MKTFSALYGLCVGDALGVPVEFQSRAQLKKNPVTDMREHGTHDQPAGTWSDDSSMAFCLAESLCKGYNLDDIADRFRRWAYEGYWTPHGVVFDIGISTRAVMDRLASGVSPRESGGRDEKSNGNGSLMRCLPLVFYLKDKDIETRYRVATEVSAITHAHIRSTFSCFLYLEYALYLLNDMDKWEALRALRTSVVAFLKAHPELISAEEQAAFYRILGTANLKGQTAPIEKADEADVSGSGYVLATLEASFWAFLTTDDYDEAVFRAINLGEDTDTTGCVTGGLAGLYYGWETISDDWCEALARKDDIEELAEWLDQVYPED